jgi:hypothetical protein
LASGVFKFLRTQVGSARSRVLFSDSLLGYSSSIAIDQADKERVKIFGYMRGLDGKLPDKGDKAASVAENKPDTKDQKKSDAEVLVESPEGKTKRIIYAAWRTMSMSWIRL